MQNPFKYLAIILMLNLSVFAQQSLDTTNILPEKIISVDFISAGANFPIGSFSKRVKTSENSGFANVGFKLDAGFNYQIYKNLGVKAMLIYQNNQIDSYKYKKDLIAENAANSYSISASGWNNFSGLFGAYANFNLDENLSMQPKVLLGFSYGMSPEINLTVSDTVKSITKIKQHSNYALGFCYLIGIDFKIKLVARSYMFFGVDSFNSDLNYNNSKVENTTTGTSATASFKQPTQTISLKVGFGKIIK